MNSIFFVILRRMRPPLLALIAAYAVSILGLTLIPGVDGEGRPWRFDFFHAFYFVSYTATTIGFGELPHAFTAAQRAWVIFGLYLTVIAWLYAIGKLIALLQDDALRQAIKEARFARSVRRLREPFCLVCGYGETGAALVRALASEGRMVVVIDNEAARIRALSLEEYPIPIPALIAEAHTPDILRIAGLRNPRCEALIAVTRSDAANLHIAITGKLLHPRVKVIARAGRRETAANMVSFGTDHVIDSFQAFADRLFVALQSPCLDALSRWLLGQGPLAEPHRPPHGLWLLCGYGRFGKALLTRFRAEGIETVVLESKPEKTGVPHGKDVRLIQGWGTEAADLLGAGVKDAVGIVAGTGNDTNNLSILMTARDLNPNLYMVARQNEQSNTALFRAIRADQVAEGSRILSERIRTLLNQPLLAEFLARIQRRGDGYARQVLVNLASRLGEGVPRLRQIRIRPAETPNLCARLAATPLTCGAWLNDIPESDGVRPVMLCLKRASEPDLLPEAGKALRQDDQLLIAMAPDQYRAVERRL